MKSSSLYFFWILLFPLVPVLIDWAYSLRFRQSAFSATIKEEMKEKLGEEFSVEDLRLQLLIAVDLEIRYQNLFKEHYGKFNQAHGRLPQVFGPLSWIYKTNVTAVKENLIIEVWGDPVGGWLSPKLTQDIQRDHLLYENQIVRSSFPEVKIPAQMLRSLAQMTMAHIIQNHGGAVPDANKTREFEGIFHSHFQYESRMKSTGEQVLMAVPASFMAQEVLGKDPIRFDPTAESYLTWVERSRKIILSSLAAQELMFQLFFAQKLHYNLTGEYSSDLYRLIRLNPQLVELSSNQGSFNLENLQRDFTLGFQADVSELGATDQVVRLWNVNGQGQLQKLNPVESLMGILQRGVPAAIDVNRGISSDRFVDSIDPLSRGKKLPLEKEPRAVSNH